MIAVYVGWALNVALFIVFLTVGIIDERFWRRPIFWITAVVPFFYVLMALWYLWEIADGQE